MMLGLHLYTVTITTNPIFVLTLLQVIHLLPKTTNFCVALIHFCIVVMQNTDITEKILSYVTFFNQQGLGQKQIYLRALNIIPVRSIQHKSMRLLQGLKNPMLIQDSVLPAPADVG